MPYLQLVHNDWDPAARTTKAKVPISPLCSILLRDRQINGRLTDVAGLAPLIPDSLGAPRHAQAAASPSPLSTGALQSSTIAAAQLSCRTFSLATAASYTCWIGSSAAPPASGTEAATSASNWGAAISVSRPVPSGSGGFGVGSGSGGLGVGCRDDRGRTGRWSQASLRAGGFEVFSRG